MKSPLIQWQEDVQKKFGMCHAQTLGITFNIMRDADKKLTLCMVVPNRRPELQKGFETVEDAKLYAEGLLCRELNRYLNHEPSTISNIKKWFETAIPNPTIATKTIQIGVCIEEFTEMLDALGQECEETKQLAEQFKSNKDTSVESVKGLTAEAKVALLDALCDQIVTAIGVASYMRMDIEGALAEVNRSNWTKFEDGKVVTDAKGKITKGKGYTPPELQEFIHDDE